MVSLVFYIKIDQESVSHLFPDDHVWSAINVFRLKDLSETELVGFIRKDAVFIGPHRYIVHKLVGEYHKFDGDPDFLSCLTWCKNV